MFKNETHNHPTEIEPFGGAATCIGGCIRDPLSGRAYVHQAMRVTGCGDPRMPLDGDPARQAAPAEAVPRPPRRAIPPTATRSAWPPAMWRSCTTPATSPSVWRCGAVVGAAPAYNVPPGAPRSRGRGHPAGRPHRPGRHRRRHRLLQEPQPEIPRPPWPPRCRRATPPRSARSSACSGTARSPA